MMIITAELLLISWSTLEIESDWDYTWGGRQLPMLTAIQIIMYAAYEGITILFYNTNSGKVLTFSKICKRYNIPQYIL